MPEPTPEEPFVQVEWLFDSRESLAESRSAADNFQNAKHHFLKYLETASSNTTLPYQVNDHFDEYTLW